MTTQPADEATTGPVTSPACPSCGWVEGHDTGCGAVEATAEAVPCVCGAQLTRPYPNDTGHHSTTECIDEAADEAPTRAEPPLTGDELRRIREAAGRPLGAYEQAEIEFIIAERVARARSRLTVVVVMAERASRKGYDLDPDDVLEACAPAPGSEAGS